MVVADGLADELHVLRGPPGHGTGVRHVELWRGWNSEKDRLVRALQLDSTISQSTISFCPCEQNFEAAEEAGGGSPVGSSIDNFGKWPLSLRPIENPAVQRSSE